MKTALIVMMTVAPCAVAGSISVPSDFATIQEAIVASVDGDEVVVAPGIYNESLDFSGKLIVVRSEGGAEQTVVDGTGHGSAVVFQSGETREARLEGFTIVGGTGTFVGLQTFGGGVFCRGASPTIRANRIRSNSALRGGGIACWENASPLVENNVLEYNAAGSGGAIVVDSASFPKIASNQIRHNIASFQGGGIAVWERSAPEISNNDIVQNRSGGFGGGLYFGTASGMVFENTIRENTAENEFINATKGGGILCEASDDVRILRNEIARNITDGRGGGIALASSTARVEQNRIEDNRASSFGGGVAVDDASEADIMVNRVLGNHATSGGGIGVLLAGPSRAQSNIIAANNASSQGGGVWVVATDLICAGNTLVANSCRDYGGAIEITGVDLNITNCIFWDNTPNDVRSDASRPSLSNCIIPGGWIWPGENNIDADPLFMNQSNGDYRLRFGSPAVDTGSQSIQAHSTDADGEARIVDGDFDEVALIDIGAYELHPELQARFGNVGAASGSIYDVLSVAGDVGDHRRVVRVNPDSIVTVEVARPPCNEQTKAPFVMYVWSDEPDRATVTVQPFNLGVMGFPTPLTPVGQNRALAIWNNLGFVQRLGSATLPSSPAPTTLLEASVGSLPRTITIQGFIYDESSSSEGPLSIMNAVVLRIEESG